MLGPCLLSRDTRATNETKGILELPDVLVVRPLPPKLKYTKMFMLEGLYVQGSCLVISLRRSRVKKSEIKERQSRATM